MANPKRGEVWLVDLGIIAKIRPALIVSVAPEEDDRGLFTMVPRTTQQVGTLYEVDIRLAGMKDGAFDVQNLSTQIRRRFLRKLGKLSSVQMDRVEETLKKWLGFDSINPSDPT